ncbi:MAG TPA: bacillithiol biosynthesis BshC, partial [Sphingobacteriaceae bacterium]
SYPDLFLGMEKLKKKWVLSNSSRDLQVREEWQEFERTFETLKEKAGKIDKTLQPSTDAIRSRLKKAVDNLEKKFLRAEKRNQAHALNQLEALKNRYFPSGLQERSENFGAIYARQGEAFIDALIESFHPLDFKFTIVEFAEKN